MKHLLKFSLVAIATIVAWGCEKETNGGTTTGTAGDTAITLTLHVPGINTPATRSLTTADESEIDALDVLVFEMDGTDETFLYATHGSVTANSNEWRVPLRVSGNGRPHRLVLLANLTTAVEEAYQAGEFITGRAKNDLLETIIFDASGTWDTTTPDYLPMWGESGQLLVSHNNISAINPIRMVRSVARVDLVMNPDALGAGQGFTNFTLDQVKIYNASEKGFAVPAPGNITGYLATDPTVDPATLRTARSYPLSATQKKTGLTRDIYIAEADNHIPSMAYADQTCLIISGLYGTDANPTWYRIDFQSTATPPNTWDILRNHRYTVGVTSIDGRGYDTEDEAIRSKAHNIITEVQVWDEADLPDVSTDGQYFLKINTDSLHFYREGRAQQLIISTDHPDGWTIEVPTGMQWVNPISQTTGVADAKDEVDVACETFTPTPPALDHREGYIIVKAGRITRHIKIFQENVAELTIEVKPTTLTFRKSAMKPQIIEVSTYPLGMNIWFTEAPGPNPVTWLPAYGIPASGFPNAGIYTLHPEPRTDGTNALYSTLVTVFLRDAQGGMVGKTVTIYQLASDYLFEVNPAPANPYPAAGGTFDLTVNSETDWSIPSHDPVAATWISYDNAQKYPSGNGRTFEFILDENKTWQERKVELEPDSDNDEFSGQNIEIIQGIHQPELNVSPLLVDLGNTPAGTAAGVTVTSNANWTVTGATGFDVIYTSTTPAATPALPGGTSDPVTQTPTQLTFIPKAYTVNTLPAAGEQATTATIATVNHAPATADSKDVTVKRTIPAEFDFISAPASIARAGGNAVVTVSTNAAWYARESLGNNVSATKAPAPYAVQTAEVAIPENKIWSAYTYPVNRQINIETFYGPTTAAMTNSGGTKPVSQAGYYISVATSDLTVFNSGIDTDVSVTLTGAFDERPVRAWDITNSKALITRNMPPQESGTGSLIIPVPAGSTWGIADIIMQYQHGATGNWIDIGNPVTQQGYDVTFTATGTPLANGFYVTVTASGYGPDIQLRASSNDILISGSETMIASGDLIPRSTDLIVSANRTYATREILIEWYHPEKHQWEEISKFNQKTAYITGDGAIISTQRMGPIIWAEAAGLPLIYNTTMAPTTNGKIYPELKTGCGSYTEPTLEDGWRLPTGAEMVAIRLGDYPYSEKEFQGFFPSKGANAMWTSDQSFSGLQAGLVIFTTTGSRFTYYNTIGIKSDSKYHMSVPTAEFPNTYWARCVHD